MHSGIYAIFQYNLTTKSTTRLVDSLPGGASRPELSHDRRTLAFVRRVRDKEALVLKYLNSKFPISLSPNKTFSRDLKTGSIHNVWHGLSYDLTIISAPMGTYPSFSFIPDDTAIIIWAAGQIYSVPLALNSRGERIASDRAPYPIRFTAHIEKRLAETRREEFDIVALETQDTQPVRAMKELRVDDTGRRVVFQAAGANYWYDVHTRKTSKIPVTDEEAPYFSPSFIHGADDFIIHVRWSDLEYSQFELADLKRGKAYNINGLPHGRYFSPVLCECQGRKKKLVYIKSAGSYLSGNILSIAEPGLYIADITLPSPENEDVTIENIQFVPSEIDVEDRVNMRFISTNKVLLIQQSSRAFTLDLSSGRSHHTTTLASGQMSSEIVVSPISRRKGDFITGNIAFVDFNHVYLASSHKLEKDEAVWSRPGNATKGLARLSLDGGHDVTWSRDGKYLFWFLGAFIRPCHLILMFEPNSSRTVPSLFGSIPPQTLP